MSTSLLRTPSATTLLKRLIDTPDLVRAIRALPDFEFAELVRRIGVEDAGEVVALATTRQLVATFDEDLFANPRPGEREVFDAGRFAVWLEILLEAGEKGAADRIAELSEDFVVQALSSLVMVLDSDGLAARMGDSELLDKALASALCEEIDGYLLISRTDSGWDAVMALVLALDSNQRPYLERILDRCADMASPCLDDLDLLLGILSNEDSLADDVEGEREARRGRLGHVEPRAARNFLALARRPVKDAASEPRDPVSRAYFRELDREAASGAGRARQPEDPVPADEGPNGLGGFLPALPAGAADGTAGDEPADGCIRSFLEALRSLGGADPEAFAARMAELAYLANVLVAGATIRDRRFRPAEASEAALATVAFGAQMEARSRLADRPAATGAATADALRQVLAVCSADNLFRAASGSLAAEGADPAACCFVRSLAELDALMARFRTRPPPDRPSRRVARRVVSG
jgi:hypothetical protein